MYGTTPREACGHVVGLKERLCAIREGIAGYLDRVIMENKGLPARSFYGESFSYLLLSSAGSLYRKSLDMLISSYAAKDKESPEFHWEFNKYAWINAFNFTRDPRTRAFAYPLRFKHTPATNWVMLRCCTQILANHDIDEALQDAHVILRIHQKNSGLICDDAGVRSLQYHCFSAVLTAEIYLLCENSGLKRRFAQSARFIENLILGTGDALYVGRGQQQSFGYGALIYLLALACFVLKDFNFLRKLEKCVSFLSRFQRQDGSFPLVMNGFEEGFQGSADPTDPLFPGWYAYNNYFDYLPFLGVMLAKSETVLASIIDVHEEFFGEFSSEDDTPAVRYQDSDFLVVRRPSYEAVVARPGGSWKGGGFWTNDLPMPYIVCRGSRITPSYGGEQYGHTMYEARGIPLPLIRVGEELMPMRHGRIWSVWCGNVLTVITLRAVLIRSFDFKDEQVIVRDILISPFKTYHYYLFEDVREIKPGNEFMIRGGARVFSDEYLIVESRKQFFWGGALTALRSSKPSISNTLTISLEFVE